MCYFVGASFFFENTAFSKRSFKLSVFGKSQKSISPTKVRDRKTVSVTTPLPEGGPVRDQNETIFFKNCEIMSKSYHNHK